LVLEVNGPWEGAESFQVPPQPTSLPESRGMNLCLLDADRNLKRGMIFKGIEGVENEGRCYLVVVVVALWSAKTSEVRREIMGQLHCRGSS
jgi:hypothetical protein